MEEQKKPRIRIIGNTVYEINRRTNKVEGVFHGKDSYFESHRDENIEEIDESVEEEPYVPPHIKRKKLQAFAQGVIGNKRKLTITSKADGLDKEIAIIDVEEPKKAKERLFRKKKSSKPKQKRKIVKKIKKCRCK